MSQDREFEKYLEGKSEVSQLYAGLPQVELPKHLDAAILAEAHRAVNARPGAGPKRRWAIPLGMVATLFVAVMIGLQLPYILQDAASPRQDREEKIAAMMDNGIAERPAAAPQERKKVQEPDRVMPNAKSALEPVAQPAAKSIGVMQKPPVAESSQLGSTAVVASPAVAAPAPVPAPAPAPEEKRFGLSESGDTAKSGAQSKEKKTYVQPADRQNDSFEQYAPATTRLDSVLKDKTSEKNLTPDESLERIKRLKGEGKLEEAKKELAVFKKRYPEYPLPKELEFK
jgi:hypothetical protein